MWLKQFHYQNLPIVSEPMCWNANVHREDKYVSDFETMTQSGHEVMLEYTNLNHVAVSDKHAK